MALMKRVQQQKFGQAFDSVCRKLVSIQMIKRYALSDGILCVILVTVHK